MANALAGLATTVRSFAGETVTYRRGAESVQITAVAGRESRTQILDPGLAMAGDELLWRIAPGDLVIASVAVVPERGDEIVRTVGSAVQTWVVRPDLNGAAYQADGARTCFTVRTKLEATS